MALLEQWQKVAYNEKADRGELQRFWQRYFLLEKGVYEQLLTNPDEKVEGTVKELAEKYNLSVMEMTGFLDGINDSLVEANPIDTMEAFTDLPCVQFYAGNFIAPVTGKNGVFYDKRNGFCLESQYVPNAINQEGEEKPILEAGDTYDTTTVYKFIF